MVLEHHDAPAFLFTPDGEFPVGYGKRAAMATTSSRRPFQRQFDGI
ncbi:MAG: hypothetical protein ACLRWF_03480 [Ruthenibacterium sp.]